MLLVLVILVTAIFFCHSMIRLSMMIIKPPVDNSYEGQYTPQTTMISGGYSNPPQPIRVALARDEEAVGIVSEATKFPPPAYGLWRESVRVDPNRIYWSRNNQAPLERSEESPQTTNRPPSYISDNGVDYIIEAQARSTAPLYDVPLPPHPSERQLDGCVI